MTNNEQLEWNWDEEKTWQEIVEHYMDCSDDEAIDMDN